MAPTDPIYIQLEGEDDTNRLAAFLAPLLRAGDVVLLDGPIGAGKTHFCRAVIRARLGRQEDVPSPTFTLVQTYDADVEIWHADLYRLSHPDEALELGLEDAFVSAICLVEWPERLGDHAPVGAIRLTLAPSQDGRLAEIRLGGRGVVAARLAQAFGAEIRAAARLRLLGSVGWDRADSLPLAGDASARRYERLSLAGESRILMDSPPGIGDDVGDFARIDRHLLAIGLTAPVIHAEDLAQGLLLTEDFGDGVFARLIENDPAAEGSLYQAAVDVLVRLQTSPPAPALPDLSAADWAQAAAMVLQWYSYAATGEKPDTGPFVAGLTDTMMSYADGPRVMILRDYHAENLMWLPSRQGVQRVGLLDFQLGQLGQPGYDLVSLLQDARRDVGPEVERLMIHRFLDATGRGAAAFLPAYAALGAQRALRIIGVFARLCLVAGKPGYVALIPRVWGQLQRNLARPELSALRAICATLPEPSPTTLDRIRAQCSTCQ
ncbi:MAG: tRNA (adenosine(37)-N6)-threonylcarbamoyltransferase complex ATPase subunit type 1 TsaE [bacterium]